jgi:hypothetical protein
MVQYPTNFGDESMTDREDFIPRAQVRSSRTMRRLTTLDPIPFGPYKGTVMMDLPRRYVEHLDRQSWLHHARETNQPHHLLTPMRGMTSDVRLFLTRQESDEAVERMLADAQKWDANLVHRIRRSSAEESSGSEHQREDNATPVFARDIPPDSEEMEAEEFTHSYGQPLSFRSREIAALSLARLEQLEKAQRRFGDADLERRAETFTRDQLL